VITVADRVERVDGVEQVEDVAAPSGFAVHLDNFEGPFDLLLQLIARHQLDISDIALSKVTDEFIAHLKAMGDEWELDQTTQFLVVASTLLDLKVVRLLPSADLEDEEDLALLEARDLLFARLMQYRAFKQVAAVFGQRLATEARRHPRAVGLDERYAAVLPDVLITLSLDEFAALAAKALEPRPEPVLGLAHLHVARVSIREQAAILVDRLRRHQTMTFRALVADSPDTLTTVGRFLALLELFRENAVAFEQVTPLGDLNIRWTGVGEGDIDVSDEYDEHPDAGNGEQTGAESDTGDVEAGETANEETR
jgi:segregation and condensation protein A